MGNKHLCCTQGILEVAKDEGVDCIHPGYGFLSENSNFARRCAEEGIVFIGPKPETILQMGDKTQVCSASIPDHSVWQQACHFGLITPCQALCRHHLLLFQGHICTEDHSAVVI